MSSPLPELVVRPIRPSDAELLEAGLARLSPETVYRRFLSPKPHLSRRELRYLTEVDGVSHHALVAVPAGDPSELIAVGRWVRLAEDPDVAEAAIVVGDCWQGRGVGRMLGLRLADAACRLGVREFTATMLPDNAPAHRLLALIQARLAVRPCWDPATPAAPALAA
jgi:RimJ/RimL family protein N-acetyltransferase